MSLHSLTIKKLIQFKVIKLVGLEHASKEEKQGFLNHAADLIMARVAERIEKELPEDKKETYLQLFVEEPSSDETTDAERNNFLRKYVPHFFALYWDEFLIFKSEVVQIAQDSGPSEATSSGLHYSRISQTTAKRKRYPLILLETAIILGWLLKLLRMSICLFWLPVIGVWGLIGYFFFPSRISHSS